MMTSPFSTTSSLSVDDQRRWAWGILIALAAWASAVAALGAAGLFAKLPLPLLAALVAVGTVAPIIAYYRHTRFQAFMRGVPIEHLTLFHVWRVPAALVFFFYGAQGLLPETFVRNAAWGDLIAGLLVPVVLLLPRGHAKFLGFHLFGLADFIVAVGTGLTFSLLELPLMSTIATFPIVLIPLFGVCVSGASHVIAIDRLLAERRVTRTSVVTPA
jgi:hypothetical protein